MIKIVEANKVTPFELVGRSVHKNNFPTPKPGRQVQSRSRPRKVNVHSRRWPKAYWLVWTATAMAEQGLSRSTKLKFLYFWSITLLMFLVMPLGRN